MPSLSNRITCGARSSPLSRAQVTEIQRELLQHHPEVILEGVYVETTGDIDLNTSLRTLGHTDFFTKEVDTLLLQGTCRIAVHSAKDLPKPLTHGIEVICITKGVDPSDSLVLRNGITWRSLKKGAVIATSSERREQVVKTMRSDLTFRDVRGPIGMRLALLETGEADGVVIAEAALIRLGLTHLNRIRLPGATTPLQGQLAVTARNGDDEMRSLFACLSVT